MIVATRLDLPRLVKHVGPGLAVLLVYDLILTILYVVLHIRWLAIPNLPLALFGTGVGLMLTLRNNAAYARWWEARTLWGAVVNQSRSFARSLMATLDDASERATLVRHQLAYVHALRLHLLRRPVIEKVASLLPEETLARLKCAVNIPTALQMEMGGRLRDASDRGLIDSIRLQMLNAPLSELANAQGGLERIRNTPLPRHYSQLPQLFTIVYCLLLPLGLLPDLELYTPVGSTVIGFMFLALDRTGRYLEEPLAGTVHDVPMLAITTTIEIDLLQSIGETGIPAPVQSRRGVLP